MEIIDQAPRVIQRGVRRACRTLVGEAERACAATQQTPHARARAVGMRHARQGARGLHGELYRAVARRRHLTLGAGLPRGTPGPGAPEGAERRSRARSRARGAPSAPSRAPRSAITRAEAISRQGMESPAAGGDRGAALRPGGRPHRARVEDGQPVTSSGRSAMPQVARPTRSSRCGRRTALRVPAPGRRARERRRRGRWCRIVDGLVDAPGEALRPAPAAAPTSRRARPGRASRASTSHAVPQAFDWYRHRCTSVTRSRRSPWSAHRPPLTRRRSAPAGGRRALRRRRRTVPRIDVVRAALEGGFPGDAERAGTGVVSSSSPQGAAARRRARRRPRRAGPRARGRDQASMSA